MTFSCLFQKGDRRGQWQPRVRSCAKLPQWFMIVRCEILVELGASPRGSPLFLGSITVRDHCDPQGRVCGGFTNRDKWSFFSFLVNLNTIPRTFPILLVFLWLVDRISIRPHSESLIYDFHLRGLGEMYPPHLPFRARLKIRWQYFLFI